MLIIDLCKLLKMKKIVYKCAEINVDKNKVLEWHGGYYQVQNALGCGDFMGSQRAYKIVAPEKHLIILSKIYRSIGIKDVYKRKNTLYIKFITHKAPLYIATFCFKLARYMRNDSIFRILETTVELMENCNLSFWDAFPISHCHTGYAYYANGMDILSNVSGNNVYKNTRNIQSISNFTRYAKNAGYGKYNNLYKNDSKFYVKGYEKKELLDDLKKKNYKRIKEKCYNNRP